jgi:hypothetical protein
VLTVPNAAIAWQAGATSTASPQAAVWVAGAGGGTKTLWVCPMDPTDVANTPGKAKCGMDRIPKQVPDPSAPAATGGRQAHLIHVTLGQSDGVRTEVVAGLTAGQGIITAGPGNLREGDAIFPTPGKGG